MPQPFVLPGPVIVQGSLSCTSFTAPSNSVANNAIPAGANIDAAKLAVRHKKEYAQASGANAAVARQVVHVARAAGSVSEFQVGAVVKPTAGSTVTVDLLKNGASVLSGVVTVDSTTLTANFGITAGAVTTTGLVAGDVLEVQVVSAAAGGGALPQGLFAQVTLDENAV